MKSVIVAFLAIGFGLAQPLHVKLDPNQTKINFILGDVLHTIHGTFKLGDGDIWIDAATGKAGGRITVSADTGDSGSRARDSRMDKSVLQTSKFPEITFAPDRIDGQLNEAGESTFHLHGLFGIHGATHDLTMIVKSHIEGNRVTANADFDVPYVKWGMKDPSTLFLRVDKMVRIEIAAAGKSE
ncbi:MAG TPA: YceI family protein [Bryobacteraceae bacterium]|nr:YceI family protein [Bryobacteraceae bacterium]